MTAPLTVAIDFETHLIQPGLLAPPPVCGSMAAAGTPGAVVFDAPYTLDCLAEYLTAGDHIVGANIAFDLAVAAAARPALLPRIFQALDEGRVHDTHIRQALDAIAGGHLNKDPRTGGGPLRDPETGRVKNRYSLAICCDITLGRAVAKADTWRMRYAKLAGVPLADWPADALEYPRDDARNTLDLYEAQAKTFENLQCEPGEVRAAFALHLMAVRGLRTDPVRVAEVVKRVEEMHAETLATFKAAGIYRADGTKDTKALAARVTAAYGGTPPLTDTGRVKTDRDALAESGDEVLEALAEAGENEKLFAQYLDVIQRGTRVPINAAFNVLVESGRTSCGNPNLQNLPRVGGVRECFAARPGFVFASVDYAALELCTLAQVQIAMFGRSAMADAINASPDGPGALHTDLAAAFIGSTYEELAARIAAGDKAAKNLRQAAKAANFGFPGGMGAPKLVLAKRKEGLRFCVSTGAAEVCGVERITSYKGRDCPSVCRACVEVAEALRQAWFKRWPEMKPYFAWVSQQTAGDFGGTIESLGNGMRRGGCRYTEGANHRFQNLAAQGAKRALWELARECYTDRGSVLWGARPVVFVHDEIIAELPEATAPEAAERMAEIMRTAMTAYVPDVKIGAEPCLMRNWFKDAATVRDASGRLVVWEPTVGR